MLEGFCLEMQPRDCVFIGDNNYESNSIQYYNKYISAENGLEDIVFFNMSGAINSKTHCSRGLFNEVNVYL